LAQYAKDNIRMKEIKKKEEEEKKKRELEEAEKRRKEKLEEERKKREEEQERRRREEEAKAKAAQDEVLLAAQSVTQAVNKIRDKLGFDFPEYTSEGKLFDAARLIGKLMALLSEASRNKHKGDMIKYSREISAAVKNIHALAQEQAGKCTHPILRDNLLIPAQAAGNYSVQLKIISAVKAAAEGDSTLHVKMQLVRCAKELAGAVIKTIEGAEVAAIKNKDKSK